MPRSDFHTTLLNSDKFAEYSLRSSFFLRRLRAIDLWKAIGEVQRLANLSDSFPWTQRLSWGIEEEAWSRATEWKVEPLLLFCHPRVLTEQPRLLLYYRTVALLSQKGFTSLVRCGVERIESGRVEELPAKTVTELVVALNSVISAFVIAGAQIQPTHLAGIQFAAAGATIQGSWNNQVGAEGEAAVRTILLNHLKAEVLQIVFREGARWSTGPKLHRRAGPSGRHQSCATSPRVSPGVASEPDISLRDAQIPLIAIEVKAGNDTAALERLAPA